MPLRPNNYIDDVEDVFAELSLLKRYGIGHLLPFSFPLQFASKRLLTQHLLSNVLLPFDLRCRTVRLHASQVAGLRVVNGELQCEVPSHLLFPLKRALTKFQDKSFRSAAARRWSEVIQKHQSLSLIEIKAQHVFERPFSTTFFSKAYVHHFQVNDLQIVPNRLESHRLDVDATLGYYGERVDLEIENFKDDVCKNLGASSVEMIAAA